MSFHKETTRKARKNHVCEWCLNSILPKTNYISSSGVFEGEFYSYNIHENCNENLKEVGSLYRGDCFDYELTLEYCRERACDENPELVSHEIKGVRL